MTALLSPLRSPLQPALRGPLQAGIGGGLRILDFASLTATQLQSRFGWVRSGAGTLTDSGSAVRYGAHNLLSWSNDPTNAAWLKQHVQQPAQNGTDDSRPRWEIFKSNVNDTAFLQTPTFENNSALVMRVRLWASSNSTQADVGLINTTGLNFLSLVAWSVSGPGALSDPFVSNAIRRVTGLSTSVATVVTMVLSTAGFHALRLYPDTAISTTVGRSLIAQTESVNIGALTDYVPTTTAPVYLMLTPDYSFGVPGALLQGARTQLFANSTNASTLVSTGLISNSLNVVGPMGATSLATLVENTSNTVHGATRSSSIGVGTYAVSAHMKAGTRRFVHVLLDDGANAGGVRVDTQNWTVTTETNGGGVSSSNPFVIPLANGIYRVGATVTSTSSLNNFGVYGSSDNTSAGRIYLGVGFTIIAGDIQLEAGAYPTSYIPNPGTGTLLRVADVAVISGTEFSAGFNQAAGTYVIDCTPMSNTGTTVLSLDDGNGGYDEYLSVYWNNGQLAYVYYAANVLRYGNYTAGTITAGTRAKIGVTYSNGSYSVCLNGATPASGGSGAPSSTMSRLRIFGDLATSVQNDGVIHRLTYYPVAITGAALQALTV